MLFERRWLQQAVTSLASLVPRQRLRGLCADLNSPRVNALHAMWEVAISYAATQIASVVYEPSFGGSSQPDLLVRFGGLEFLLDITSISNLAQEKKEPLEPFMEEFTRRTRKRGITVEGFALTIGSRWARFGKHVEPTLAIPAPGNYDRFFTSGFEAFLSDVNHGRAAVFKVDTDEFKVEIGWEPGRKYMTSHYAGLGRPTSLERNSLYKRLRSKASQLRNSGFAGTMGIVACDAGNRIFPKSSMSQVTFERVVQHFLVRNSSVDFVSIITSRVHRGNEAGRTSEALDMHLFFQPAVNATVRATVTDFFDGLATGIPIPNIDAHNARGWQERHGGLTGKRHLGSLFSWRREKGQQFLKVSVSARSLLGLLSGRMSLEQFSHQTFLFPTSLVPNSSNPFRDSLAVPERLVDVRLEQGGDDDWIELFFEGPDPADGPIKIPEGDAE
jgi:hypothetical protein